MPYRISEETFEWSDRDTYETIRLVAAAYRLAVEAVSPRGPRTAVVTLSGEKDSLARLSCDMKILGAAEPFITECPPSRAEYLIWLRSELSKIGIEFVPDFSPSAVKSE